ncbi:transglutaminaseTgpA domain-containing protein [Bacillus sp. 165]|uniref:transglutaminase TgpA family protein n=1 Tax=Bacillus sp. 165 TaxID=1529117 RepID=UPI001ADB62CE|nr:transglutaminaseTgpA domain-containing protein [Bacillus sp. 165]MBO9128979.1 DUF4129 domain-containing protein [Bacillus sp. 165]
MKSHFNKKRDMESFFIHTFAFFLIWECLRPLESLEQMTRLDIFLQFTILCVILSFFQVKRFAAVSIKLAVIFFMMRPLYHHEENTSWLTVLISDLFHNVALLVHANMSGYSPLFRTFLFFIILWLISNLMLDVMRRRRILLFFVLCIIYILSFHSFSTYDAKGAIVRITAVGFVMLGFLHISRIAISEKLQANNITKKALLPLTGVVLVTAIISYYAPKAEPQWSNPFLFIEGYTKGGTLGDKGNVKKVGYSVNDSNLGGPISDDSTVVFKVKADTSNYWRVETKDYYTGKGWEVSKQPIKRSFRQDNTVMSWYEPETKTVKQEALITMNLQYFHVIYPTGLLSINTDSDILYSTDPFLEKISSYKDGSRLALDQYTVLYEVPEFSVEKLKAAHTGEGLESNPDFVNTYTQLPPSLPERVRNLAKTITKDKANRYDQAAAIESYLKNSSFVYSKEETPFPEKDEDYVDQFLFDSKIGYCNNYSTSMIVLLRSLGIPSRWVKGYTGGTLDNSSDSHIYTVTNNDAHSWVEAYFPGYGWVPFEPTKGFSSPYRFVDESTPAASPNEAAPTNQQQPEQNKQKQLFEDDQATNDKKAAVKQPFPWSVVLIGSVLLTLIGYVLFITRMLWFYLFAIVLYRFRRHDAVFFKAYDALLKQLTRAGVPRKDSQTLREYAIYVDKTYKSTNMQKLTASYEQALYKKEGAEWKASAKLWGVIMKQASSKLKDNPLDKAI